MIFPARRGSQPANWPTFRTLRPGLVLERLRGNWPASDVILWSASGQLQRRPVPTPISGTPSPHSNCAMRARQRSPAHRGGLDEAGANAAPTKPGSGIGRGRTLLTRVADRIPISANQPTAAPTLVANAIAVQEANREYQGGPWPGRAATDVHRHTHAEPVLAMFPVLIAAVLGNRWPDRCWCWPPA